MGGGVFAPSGFSMTGGTITGNTALGSEGMPGVGGGVFGGIVTSLLLPRYQGRRGFSIKYFFYIYYPAHIAILGLIHQLLVG